VPVGWALNPLRCPPGNRTMHTKPIFAFIVLFVRAAEQRRGSIIRHRVWTTGATWMPHLCWDLFRSREHRCFCQRKQATPLSEWIDTARSRLVSCFDIFVLQHLFLALDCAVWNTSKSSGFRFCTMGLPLLTSQIYLKPGSFLAHWIW